MKTRNFFLLQAFVLTLVSCTDRLSDQAAWDSGVMAAIPGYEDVHGTRVRFTNALDCFYWTNGDCIGVCRSAGSTNGTAAFTLLKGGETVGNFINDAFSLIPNSEYYAFYPFEAGTTASVFPINLANQTQTSNNDVSHIGPFNYMATSFTTDDNGKASFTFSNIGAVIQLHFTADKEETYQSLSITSSGTPFTIRAKYDLANGTYTSDGSYDTFRVLFGEDGMHVYNGEKVVITAVILPDDLSQSTLTFSIKNKAGVVVKEMDLAGYAFTSGKLYHFYEDDSKGNPPYGGCPDGNHPHAIDLGLPSGTLWSCMDLGADYPTAGGIAFAWGQTDYVEKNESNWSNYEFMIDSYNNQWGISKYQVADDQTDGVWYNEDGVFIGDNKTTLDLSDDAARKNWGGKWRMPTKEEADELLNYTKQVWTDNYNETGVIGEIFYKKKTSGSYSLWDSHIFLKGSQAHNSAWNKWSNPVWTSSLQQKTQNAYYILIIAQSESYRPDWMINTDASRFQKRGIRPVQSNPGSE